jgi:hypothetical protein
MCLWGTLWIANNLRNTVAIPQIQENQPAMIAAAIDPACQLYLLPDVLRRQFAAGMGTVMHFITHVSLTPLFIAKDKLRGKGKQEANARETGDICISLCQIILL